MHVETPRIQIISVHRTAFSQLRAWHISWCATNTVGARGSKCRSTPRRALSCCICAVQNNKDPRAPRPATKARSTAQMAGDSGLVKEELPNDNDSPETHLMLFINGLNGNAGNWDVLIDKLSQFASSNEIAILCSTANMSLKVFLKPYMHQSLTSSDV